MKVQGKRILVIAAALLVLLPLPLRAAIPEPMSIPDEITGQLRAALSSRAVELKTQLQQLSAEVDLHDRKCSRVSSGNKALIAECRSSMGRLNGEIGGYSARVYDFNQDLKSAIAEARAKKPEEALQNAKTDKPRQKGLKIKEVPVPKPVAYHHSKPPEQILNNALARNATIEGALQDLRAYLNKYDPDEKNGNARFALRVLEGTVRALNADSNATVQAALLGAIVAAGQRTGQRSWPGPTEGPDKITPTGAFKEKTTVLMLDALNTHTGDLQGSYRYLAKLADDPAYPHKEAAKKALSNLRMIFKESRKSEKPER